MPSQKNSDGKHVDPWVVQHEPIVRITATDVHRVSVEVVNLLHAMSWLLEKIRPGDFHYIVTSLPTATELVNEVDACVHRLRNLKLEPTINFLNAFSRGPIAVGTRFIATNAHDAVVALSDVISWWWSRAEDGEGVADVSSDSSGGKDDRKHLRAFVGRLRKEKCLLSPHELRHLDACLAIERDSAFVLRFRIIPPEVGDLSGEEGDIIRTLEKLGEPMTGEKLLDKAGLSVHGTNKKLLAGLVQRLWLKTTHRGYALWHW